MKFISANYESSDAYKMTKYKVKIQINRIKGHIQTKESDAFDKIEDATKFIKKWQKDIKDYPELYSNTKIYLIRIKTVSDAFEVTEGD